MIKSRFSIVLVASLAFGLMIGTGGCASSGGTASPAPAADVPIPASSPLAKIELGMSELKVRKEIGDPDDANMYMTGKAWIPFYYGPDTHRTDWKYSGVGRVVFSRNRYTGALKVIRLIHNPEEP